MLVLLLILIGLIIVAGGVYVYRTRVLGKASDRRRMLGDGHFSSSSRFDSSSPAHLTIEATPAGIAAGAPAVAATPPTAAPLSSTYPPNSYVAPMVAPMPVVVPVPEPAL